MTSVAVGFATPTSPVAASTVGGGLSRLLVLPVETFESITEAYLDQKPMQAQRD